MTNSVVILSGSVAAGKSRLAEILSQRYGAEILKTNEVVKKAVSDETRFALIHGGNSLDDATNGQWVADAAKKVKANRIVIDCVRTIPQIEAIKKAFPRSKVTHVHVFAPFATLKKRHVSRNRPGDAPYLRIYETDIECAVRALASHADAIIDTSLFDYSRKMNDVAEFVGFIGTRAGQKRVDVILGGQFGSEGKGNVVSYIAPEYDLFIRSGGANAGHKVFEPWSGEVYCFHHIPSGTRHNKTAKVALAPGAVLWVPKLLEEIRDNNLSPERLWIDPQALIVTEADREREANTIVGGIGSTGQGVGSAVSRRIMRDPETTTLARDIKELKPYLKPTSQVLDEAYESGINILVEGTQGTGLSLYHGPFPYVTSRDCSVSGILSESGVPPHNIRNIIMVIRAHPIRVQSPVGGTSGPMAEEITIEQLSMESGVPLDELVKTETTSTTKRKRRVGTFEWPQFEAALRLNSPTDLALTFADYISVDNRRANKYEELTEGTKKFIERIEKFGKVPVTLISTRFSPEGLIDRRAW